MNRAKEIGFDARMKKHEARYWVNKHRKEILLTLWADSRIVRGLSNCIAAENVVWTRSQNHCKVKEKVIP